MPYLLDANVFIQAKRLHYGMDFCPAFWDWLMARNAADDVFSIEKVGDQLQAGADELADWVDDRGPDFFLKLDPTLLAALRTVSAWAAGQAMSRQRSTPSFWSPITIWSRMRWHTDTPS